jgi:hemolysin III
MVTLKDGNGTLIFTLVWSLAFVGTVFKLFFTGRFEKVSLILYLAMGWLIVFDIKHLWLGFSVTEKWLLFLGGASYTIGVFFYAKDQRPFFHFIWHLFVLGGTLFHWFMIYSLFKS